MAFKRSLKDIRAHVRFDITFIQIENQSLEYITGARSKSAAE